MPGEILRELFHSQRETVSIAHYSLSYEKVHP